MTKHKLATALTSRMSVPRTGPVHVPQSILHPVEDTDQQTKSAVFNNVSGFWTGVPLDITFGSFYVHLANADLPIECIEHLCDLPKAWMLKSPLYVVGVDNHILRPYDLRGGWENVSEEHRQMEYDDLPDEVKFKDVVTIERRSVLVDPDTKQPLPPFVPQPVSVRYRHGGKIKTALYAGQYTSTIEEKNGQSFLQNAILYIGRKRQPLHIPVTDLVDGVPTPELDTRPSIKMDVDVPVHKRITLVEDLGKAQRIERKAASPEQQFTGAFLKELKTMRAKDTTILEYVLRNSKLLVLMVVSPYTVGDGDDAQQFEHRAVITLRRQRTDVDELVEYWKAFINDTLNYHTPQNVEARRCADLNENTLHMNSYRNRGMGLGGDAKITDMRKLKIKCRACSGKGTVKGQVCPICNGKGYRHSFSTMHVTPYRTIKFKGKMKEGKTLMHTVDLHTMLVPAFDADGNAIYMLDSNGQQVQAEREVQAAKGMRLTRNKPKSAGGADIALRIMKDVFPAHIAKWYPEQILTMGAAANTTCQNPALTTIAKNISRLQKEHLYAKRTVMQMPVFARRLVLAGSGIARQYACTCPECGQVHIYAEELEFSKELLNEVPEWQALMRANPLRKLTNNPYVSPEEKMRLSDDDIKAIFEEMDRRTMYAVEAMMSGFPDADVPTFMDFKLAADEMEAGGLIYTDAQRAKCMQVAHSVMC